MRPLAVRKLVGVALAAALAVVSGASVARADAGDCVQACVDQWLEDRQDCKDALDARLTEIGREAQACMEACEPNNFLCLASCARRENAQRHSAASDYRRCLNRANTTAWNCYRACQQSFSRP